MPLISPRVRQKIMNTRIERTFQILDKKGKSKLLKTLRNEGLSISKNRYIFIEGKINPKKLSHSLLINCCVKGWLVCSKKSVELINTDKYYKGWMYKHKAALNQKRVNYAVAFAERYHHAVKTLYTSKRASVMVQYHKFNPHLLENKDWDAYSKSYKHPAVWKDAAVVIHSNKTFDMYNNKGVLIGNFPIPPIKTIEERNFNHPALLPKYMYAVQKDEKTVRLYKADEQFYIYAQLKTDPEDKTEKYWEHGETLKAIQLEYNRKKEVTAKLVMETQKRMEELLRKTQAQNRFFRAKQLIMRLVKNYPVTFTDARNVGYCVAGIKSFCERNGIEFSENTTVPYKFLKNFNETQKLKENIAEKLAHHLLTT